MNTKQKKLGLVAALLLFAHPGAESNTGVSGDLYNIFTGNATIPEGAIEHEGVTTILLPLPPINKDLIQEIDRLRKQYIRFLQAA